MSEGLVLPLIAHKTLEEQAYVVLRRAILDGQFADGGRLVQDELAGMLGTSRIPVRDALRRLEADGLVQADGRGRYQVRTYGPEEVRESFELRELIEPYAAARAIAQLSKSDEAELAALTNRMVEAAQAGDADAYIRANRDFHTTLYQASKMERLVKIISGLWLGQLPFTPLQVPGQLQESAQEHLQLMSLIQKRDAAAFKAALKQHIRRSGEFLLKHMRTEAAQAGAAEGGETR